MRCILLFFFLIGQFCVDSQDSLFLAKKECYINTVTSEITVDGDLSEPAWQELPILENFVRQSPVDGILATKKTEIRIGHDDKTIYIAAKCYDDPSYIIQTLKRDNFGQDDGFAVLFDPVNKRTNGYAFGVNAYGAQTEILIAPGNNDASWDNKWFSAVKRYNDHYAIEMSIPLKTLRYKSGNLSWGINFLRDDAGENTSDVWSPVPRQFDPDDLGYMGIMHWDVAPQASSSNISLIPYAKISIDKQFDPNSPLNTAADIGGDAKIAVTTGLNLDLTVNPDFSQVEVDAQVTNLTRFNIFFPERRQFFIENGDVFEFGQFADQPFYSRRIGLDPNGRTVPILAGARLTGNLTDNLRIGFMNMHTKSNSDQGIDGQNYTAASFQYRLGGRSSFRGLFLNRQAYQGSEQINGDYGRNLGGELNLVTNDGIWSGQMAYFNSMKAGVQSDDHHLYGRVNYTGQRFQTFLSIQDVGANYYSDMGFNSRVENYNPITNSIERIGFTQVGSMMDFYYYPENGEKVNFHWSGLENFVWFSHGAGLNEWYTRLRHFIFFKNSSQLRFRLNNNYIELLFPFVLTDNPLPAKSYNMTEFNVQYNSGFQKVFNYQVFAVYGQFFDGTKLTYRFTANYRLQPWLNVSFGLENNHIRLDPAFGDADLTLATARAEVNFSTSLFWTTFIQYNTQSDNFNINTRLQWRYAPMSDIFAVYTDNYLIDDKFGPKSRTFVLKANYWLGI